MGGKESAKNSRARQLRWRAKHPEKWGVMRAAQKRRYYRQFQRSGLQKRRLWVKEDARIIAKRRPADRKLSKALGRSLQAIQQRRVRLSP